MTNNKLEEFKKDFIKKTKEVRNKEFQDFKETVLNIDINQLTTVNRLNVDRIKDLNDVKRILKFLDIKVETDGVIEPHGYDEVRDLFEY